LGKLLVEKIMSVRQLCDEITSITFSSRYMAAEAKPGQFIAVKCGNNSMDAMLRRPVSICRADRWSNEITVVFQVKGKGTKLLAETAETGSYIDYIGPLGNSFKSPPAGAKIAVVGGGLGIFPLLFLLEEIRSTRKDIKADAYLGFRKNDSVILREEFTKAADNIYISTDDGSCGRKGFVTDICLPVIDAGSYDIIYTCGPQAMMKCVSKAAEKSGSECYVSLEQRMGCGIGACLACACRIAVRPAEGSSQAADGGGWEYKHVCRDGPVFRSRDVVWDKTEES